MTIPVADPIVIAPSPTPFTADDAVDFDGIQRNVARWRKTPLSGLMLNSENGEEAFLSESERLNIIRAAHEALEGEKFIVAGIDCPSVTESLRLAEQYVEAGAELVRLRIPRLTDNVRGYFEQVVPRLPVPALLINQPAPGQFAQSLPLAAGTPQLIGQVCQMENVYGYIAGGNIRFEYRTRQYVPQIKKFWIGNGSLLVPGGAIGANGACLMFGNVAPAECQEIIRLTMQGKLAEAQAIQTRLIEADHLILDRGAAGIKAALDLLGYVGGPPRKPSLPLTADEKARLRAALVAAQLL